MEPTQVEFDWISYMPLIVAFATVLGGAVVALIGRWKSPNQTIAMSAQAVERLAKSVSVLTADLDRMRDEQLEDCIQFEKDLDDLRAHYDKRLSDEISKLKQQYEERISRMEQAHRDRVNVLKGRIKELENKVNGSGAVK